jgi:AcrR family transcriptional regulator
MPMAVRSIGFGRAHADRRSRAPNLLLDTAHRLFVEEGYIAIRVEDIAKAAGISRATFYKHFSEREEILAELFGRLLGRDPVPAQPGAAAGAIRDDIPPAFITAHITTSGPRTASSTPRCTRRSTRTPYCRSC